MVFFRKGGGVSTQSITLRHIFVPQSYGLFIKNKGGGGLDLIHNFEAHLGVFKNYFFD